MNKPAQQKLVRETLAWPPAEVLKFSKTRELHKGEVLFRERDPVSAIYGVEQGVVRMERHTDDDHVAVLHVAGPGQMFAEAALFSDTYHCNAVATMPTRIRAYPKAEMLQALTDHSVLAIHFMSALAHQLQDLRTRLERRNIRSARDRVTHYLHLNGGAKGRIHLTGTLMDLAAELGLSHEVLYRTLAAMEKDRAILRTKASIELLPSASV